MTDYVKRLGGAGSPAWIASVVARAEAVAALRHPALVAIREARVEGSDAVIVMEHAPGGSLEDRLAPGASLPPGVVAEIVGWLAEGLDAAHRAGVVHGDLKPSNVLFRAGGESFLSDFGHDRLRETTGQPTPGGAEYADPSLPGGQAPDAAADVFALAALCYRALAGAPPFTGESVVEVAAAARSAAPPPLAGTAPGVPAAMAAVVERALDGSRVRRYASAADFAAALAQGAEAPDGVPTIIRPSTPNRERAAALGPPGPPGRRMWRPVAALAAGLVLLAGVGVAAGLSLRRPVATTHLATPPSPSLPAGAVASPPSETPSTSAPAAVSPTPLPSHPPPAPTTAAPRRPTTPRPTVAVAAVPAAPLGPPTTGPTTGPPPALPPRGQRIAFTSTKDGRPSIYVADVSATTILRLTSDPAGDDSQPAWSPDGSRIAFTSTRDGSRQIYVMNADGTAQHRLTTGLAAHYDPAWDPTGSRIAYVDEDAGFPQVLAVPAAGGPATYAGPVPPQSFATSLTEPSWSPDGKRLVGTYVSSGSIVLLSWLAADGTQATHLTAGGPPQATEPRFSPDGSRLVYTSRLTSLATNEIWVMGADGSAQKQLTFDAGNDAQPTWSPAGDRIAFEADRGAFRQIWVMSATGASPSLVVSVAGQAYDPAWG